MMKILDFILDQVTSSSRESALDFESMNMYT